MSTRDKPHERLKAWHACSDLAKAVFRVSAEWPMEHQEVLGDEVRSSARKATEALEIGSALGDPGDFYQQTIETCGKLGRLWSSLILARDEQLIGKKDYGELEALRDHATRLVWGLRTHLRKKIERKRLVKKDRTRKK
jgi:23S rRNA-intervening sequence protein